MYVAWRELRFAKGRFALMGAVVVLITLLVGLLSGLTAGLGRESTSAIASLSADHLVFSAPRAGQKRSFADSRITEAQWRRWARTPGVARAEPLGIATARALAGQRVATVSAFGVSPGSTVAPPASRVAAGVAILSTQAAANLGARAGQRLTVGGLTLTVAAVSGDASFSHTPVVWTSLSDWQRISNASHTGGYATVIALTTRRGVDLPAADKRLGTDTVTRDGAFAAIGAYTSENGSLQLMRGFLFAISALVIGAFFTVWTIQRAGDIAVLKALGAATGYLLRDALGQAVALLLAGTACGAGLAAAFGALFAGAAPFVLSPGTILVPAAVMVALGAAGAALSVRRITSVDPLTALGGAR